MTLLLTACLVINHVENKYSFPLNPVFFCTECTYVQAKDIARARAVYKAAIAVIPNKTFTFGKIWILAAHLEVRQKDLSAARKILGMAIGEERSTEELPTLQFRFFIVKNSFVYFSFMILQFLFPFTYFSM